jgi:hypothetical protein
MTTIITVTGVDAADNSIGFAPPVSSGLVGWFHIGTDATSSIRNRASGGSAASVAGSPTFSSGYGSFSPASPSPISLNGRSLPADAPPRLPPQAASSTTKPMEHPMWQASPRIASCIHREPTRSAPRRRRWFRVAPMSRGRRSTTAFCRRPKLIRFTSSSSAGWPTSSALRSDGPHPPIAGRSAVGGNPAAGSGDQRA